MRCDFQPGQLVGQSAVGRPVGLNIDSRLGAKPKRTKHWKHHPIPAPGMFAFWTRADDEIPKNHMGNLATWSKG